MTDIVELVVNKFKNKYKIDLNKNLEIEIEGVKYPNYGLLNLLSIFKDYNYSLFEYCRIINKIYGCADDKLSYYEIPECKIENNDIVFDCGANTGIYSIYAASKCKNVYSFEPSTANRKYLKNSKNYNDNINIIPFGLSDKIENKIFAQTDNPGASRTKDCKVPEYHKILYQETVTMITIDDFVKKTGIVPNFIKMDIENGELQAINGALDTIQKYKPKLSISIHDDNIKHIEYLKNMLSSFYKITIRQAMFYDPLLICYPKGE